jgi:hypothetical protein
MKKIIISSKDITAKQWTNLVLELNILKKEWRNHATIDLSGQGIKNIITKGNMKVKPSKEAHVPDIVEF